jgi:hypothetical protein
MDDNEDAHSGKNCITYTYTNNLSLSSAATAYMMKPVAHGVATTISPIKRFNSIRTGPICDIVQLWKFYSKIVQLHTSSEITK